MVFVMTRFKWLSTVAVLLLTVGVGFQTAGAQTVRVVSTPAGLWQPAAQVEWQYELDHPLNTTNAKDMSTTVTAWNGDTPPATDPTVYDIDAIENPASTVTALRSAGDRAVCYIEVGTAGNYYSAAEEGISTTYYQQLENAGVVGKKLSGYPEYFLNINSLQTVAIVESMIQQQCAAKGFDAVETDLDETFGSNEGNTGFTITQANEESYLETLALYMNGLGLVWIAKDLDDTANQSFVSDMEPYAAGIISEQCNQYSTCSLLQPFLINHKPVMNVEYSEATAKFCQSDINAGISGAKFNTLLNGPRTPCT
jgi:hypothetical protein